MKRVSFIFLILSLVLSFTACSIGTASGDIAGKSGNAAGKGNTETAEDSNSADNALNHDDLVSLANAINPDRMKWPKEILHPDMPEFKKGKINGWAPWEAENADNIFILIEGVSEEDLDAYRSEMEAAGFTPGNNDGYHKGLYDVELQMNSDTILQISSYKTVTEKWPEALSDIPPVNAGDLALVDGANEDNPDSMNLYYINLPAEKLEAWKQELVKKGFAADDEYGSIKGENKKFNGKTYARASIWYEENGSNEWNVYFDFEN